MRRTQARGTDLPSPLLEFSLAELRCTACGAADLFAISPGGEAEYAPGRIVIARPVPVRTWCLACWARAFGGPCLAEAAD